MRSIHSLILLAGLGLAQVLQAHPLAEALEAAWARHPEAAAWAAREDAANARIDLAGNSWPGPAALGLGASRGEHGKQEWEVGLAVPLWLPGQPAAAARVAERAREVLAARRDAARLELAGELRTAWWGLAGARAVHELARRDLDSARAIEAEARRRERAGELARMQSNLAAGERARAEAALERAQADMERARLVWEALTGLPAPDRFDAEPRRAAVAPHPLARLAEAEVGLAEAEHDLARALRREAPELAASLVREREPGGMQDHRLGMKLKWPFADPSRQRQASAEALAALRLAEAGQLRRSRLLAAGAEAARQRLAAAERALVRADEAAALARDSGVLAEKGFALGEVDLATWLRLRAAAQAAEAERVEHELAAGRALSDLAQTMGVLP